MSLTYAKRSLDNIKKLGPKSEAAALKWYDYLVKNNIDILIYETLRSEAQQKQNVANGASQTMHSYHLVGQALDFAPVKNGELNYNGYSNKEVRDAIAYAVKLGFTWGGDWDRDGQTADEKFVDRPHLQYDCIPYGSDTGKALVFTNDAALLKLGTSGDRVKALQVSLNKLGFGLKTDGTFGDATDLSVKTIQKRHKLDVDGIVGSKTQAAIDADVAEKTKPVEKKASTHKEINGLRVVGTIRIVGVNSAAYVVDVPDTKKSKNLGTLARNAVVSISGSVPGWWEIIYNGKRAYVNKKYGKLVD